MLAALIAVCCLISGNVHTPTGAPIAHAAVHLRGVPNGSATSDAAGNFTIQAPPGRYDLTVTAAGYAAVTVNTGELSAGSRIDVVLEPADTPRLRTIGQVSVNGGFTLDRNAIPEMDVSRAQMDALGYSQALEALQEVPSAVIQHPDAGAPTAPAVVSLRGPDPSEAMITLDGQQLNDGNTGDIDLSQFAVPAFNSVNVTEGLGPTDLEGSNTFGGAVNFVSLRPTQQEHLNISGSVGSYGTAQSWFNATGTIGKLGYAFAGNNYQQAGQVDQYAYVVPANDLPVYCGPPTKNKTPNCPRYTHLGSTIAARLGLVDLDYNFSQRADAGVRVFTLGDNRDESSALNGIAGNPTCVFSGPGPACVFSPSGSPENNAVANPVFGDHVGPGSANFAQSIRAYDAYSRTPLGAGTLLANFFASDNNVDFEGGSASPYDVSHLDRRYNEGLSWERAFETSEWEFGGYARQETLSGLGISQSLGQSIDSYFLRGSQQVGPHLRASAGIYDAFYSTFGTTLNWRLGLSQDLGPSSVVRFSVGTGFRAPLLAERYFFPPVTVDGKLQPNPALGPLDSNCVVANGNPNERPEHATEYELGFSHLFSSSSNLDVSLYRSNLRDTIENYYPGGGSRSFCATPPGFAYEIPINIGNAVYEGAAVRYKQRFARLNVTTTLSYGLNVAYPYALGPFVSNPTSGGTLVDYQQFLGVPQQQASAVFTWAHRGWHASTAFTFAGKNNTLAQPPYMLVDAAIGKDFGRLDFTLAATNIFNAVSGPFTLYQAGVPYPGLYSGPHNTQYLANLPTDALFVQPASVRFIFTLHE
ncbi:MAG: TonB-dependent receptor [Candidatus Eremiobacteraeota bacterium]|nr:TonB-dependent receptor [Candidatus Eremiobacteraeota bacterium]MBV9055480.1 TonB-dependent receptor [Candidatus Eremiobacteraeota bacterium]